MRGAGTWAGAQSSLLTVPAFRDLFVLMRETDIIGFSSTAERQKPSCQAGAPVPQPHRAEGLRSPVPTSRPPRSRPSPGRPGSASPEPGAAPGTYVRPGRAGPSREQRRVRSRSPQLSRRGTGGGDTRIEGAGPRPQRRPDRPGDARCPLEEGFPQPGNAGGPCCCETPPAPATDVTRNAPF